MSIRLAGLALLTALAAACAAGPAPAPAPPSEWSQPALRDLESYAQAQGTTGLLIIQRGRTVLERNWPAAEAGFRADFTHGSSREGALLEDVASQQKSFVALLVGVAVDKGLLDVERPVSDYLPAGWSKADPDQEMRIKVRHLLEMNSGLDAALRPVAEPGERFFYNTPAYAKLKDVLERASGQTLDAITRDWLTKPAGMADTAWRQRPAAFAGVGNPTGLVTTPRDVARMGDLVLNRGLAADGGRVISLAQLDAIFRPTVTNPGYGRLWWLNSGAWWAGPGPEAARREGAYIPGAPADLIAAMGAQDRILYVVPSLQLVVVRLGRAASDRTFDRELWRRVAAALAAS
jgi:CubicO group peptidase (beta-lactamase class C family)